MLASLCSFTCRDALSQLLGSVKLHLEELVIERCSDFLSMGTLHFSPLASVSRLKVNLACSAIAFTRLAVVCPLLIGSTCQAIVLL